jgi:hypothetical protein
MPGFAGEPGLSVVVPDHSNLSRARHVRFREIDVFRRVFERVVEICIFAGASRGRESVRLRKHRAVRATKTLPLKIVIPCARNYGYR